MSHAGWDKQRASQRCDHGRAEISRNNARLFIALWPDPEVRKGLLAWLAAWRWTATAALVPAERLHLTLHFLGDVARARLSDLSAALSVPFASFELAFGRAQLWDNGIAVLRPHPVPEPLEQLDARLRESLERLGLPTEARSFRPHVTLARRAQGSTLPAQGPALRWSVRGYALVESQWGRQGSHRVIQRYA